ncbi:MAG TPA: DUF3048 domain-containing protein [Chloroflexota bacterium]|nr:DUF3048 domain-containing protein [Chloroflexota bacterium]
MPTAAPTPIPLPTAHLDARLWNGTADLQLDGQPVSPGVLDVLPGPHEVSAMLNGLVVDQRTVTLAPGETARVDLEAPTPQPPLAVVVENYIDARPQSGLDQADVVYETLAEGGIARFVAVYLSGDAPVVGPVRSLRHYFAFFAAEYGADLVHIGASPQGFAWRDALGMRELDESAGDPGVWRTRDRLAPHNAYTNTARDRELLVARGAQQGASWGPLHFASEAPAGSEPATTLGVTFRPSPYHVAYQWDASTGRYLRSMEGAPHVDRESRGRLAPTSVVVQFAEIDAIPNDPKNRVDIDLAGASGRLLVFCEGTVREGMWSKAEPGEPTQWLDASGQPIALPAGQVWVEVVPTRAEVTFR